MAKSSSDAGRSAPRINMELASFFDALYTNFLLRDVFAKIVPGALVLGVMAAVIFTPEATMSFVSEMSFVMWIFAIALAWLFGFVVQMLGNVTITRDAVHKSTHEKAKMDPAFENIPEIYDEDDLDYSGQFYPLWWVQMKQKFLALANDFERAFYERLSIVKEATGNMSMTLFLCAIMLALYEASDGVYTFEQSSYLMMAGGVGLIIALLVIMNHRACEEQFQFMAEVLKRESEPDGPEVES